MILLDLNMPRMNGIEFLTTIRNDDTLHNAIIFVLTTSNSEEDMVQAYKQNIAGYIVKNNVGQAFLDSISLLEHYWRVVEFP